MTSDKEKSWLRLKLREYKVKNSDITELDKRMDIIPVSIALAQAAKESGWGTSMFALEGNAIFGQWTWTGQGIEPLNKGKNEGHKIENLGQNFDTLKTSFLRKGGSGS